MRRALLSQAAHNKRLERTRHERASLLSCVGEPLRYCVGSQTISSTSCSGGPLGVEGLIRLQDTES